MRRDPGLAPERTRLAWQRFALALAVIALIALRAGLTRRHSLLGFGVAALLGGLAFALQVAGPRMSGPQAVRFAQLATLAAAVGALAIALA